MYLVPSPLFCLATGDTGSHVLRWWPHKQEEPKSHCHSHGEELFWRLTQQPTWYYISKKEVSVVNTKISGFVTQHRKAYCNEVLGYVGILTGIILQRWGKELMQERGQLQVPFPWIGDPEHKEGVVMLDAGMIHTSSQTRHQSGHRHRVVGRVSEEKSRGIFWLLLFWPWNKRQAIENGEGNGSMKTKKRV